MQGGIRRPQDAEKRFESLRGVVPPYPIPSTFWLDSKKALLAESL